MLIAPFDKKLFDSGRFSTVKFVNLYELNLGIVPDVQIDDKPVFLGYKFVPHPKVSIFVFDSMLEDSPVYEENKKGNNVSIYKDTTGELFYCYQNRKLMFIVKYKPVMEIGWAFSSFIMGETPDLLTEDRNKSVKEEAKRVSSEYIDKSLKTIKWFSPYFNSVQVKFYKFG